MKPIETEFFMQLHVLIDRPVVVGPGPDGARQFIPITGGRFEGDGLVGEVLPGGADWQVIRADGVLTVEAIYAIRTDDGIVIEVRNSGLVDRTGEQPYVRTRPIFNAPQGRCAWLNQRLFVGSITPSAQRDHVVVDVFKVL